LKYPPAKAGRRRKQVKPTALLILAVREYGEGQVGDVDQVFGAGVDELADAGRRFTSRTCLIADSGTLFSPGSAVTWIPSTCWDCMHEEPS
jgi:hypothetical protein